VIGISLFVPYGAFACNVALLVVDKGESRLSISGAERMIHIGPEQLLLNDFARLVTHDAREAGFDSPQLTSVKVAIGSTKRAGRTAPW